MAETLYALPPLLPDATYHGRPLTVAQYRAHLEVLRYLVAKGPAGVPALFVTNLDTDGHIGYVAAAQAGLISSTLDDPLAAQQAQAQPWVTWDRLYLTPRGATYLAQRQAGGVS